MGAKSLLILEENKSDQEYLIQTLIMNEFKVSRVMDAQQLIKQLDSVKPDLILLPISQQFFDVKKLCKQIKSSAKTKNTFVVLLVRSKDDDVQIEGFEAGADDIIAYSLTGRLLISKIKALLNRRVFEEETEGQELRIDWERFLIIRKGEKFELPKKEFEIMSLLYSRPDKVFTRDEIKRSLWADFESVRGRTIDVYIRKIREKIGDDIISTINGMGYKLEVD